MIRFEQAFTAHPVGQGLFYTGIIKYKGVQGNEAIFRMVFDCGSLNKLNCREEVKTFVDNNLLGDTKIDLLIISHFDADHINFLKSLLNGRKVRRLVVPFIDFEERITIVLNYLQGGDNTNDPDFTINCIINPIVAISEILEGDFQVIFINKSVDNKEFEGEVPDDSGVNNDGNYEMDFGFDQPLEDFIQDDKNIIPPNVNVKSTLDSNPGKLKFNKSGKPIMDFLFYRVNVGENDKGYFKAVYDEFLKEYSKDLKSLYPDLNTIINTIKGIENGRRIRNIFRAAAKAFPISNPPRRGVENLNSTALCLLHRNRISFYNFMVNVAHRHHLQLAQYSFIPTTIQKFDGTNNTRSEYEIKNSYHPSNYFPHRYFWHLTELPNHPTPLESTFVPPNVLLTSDSFLLTKNEVDNFYKRFRVYWEDFWLFQIPHHGSNNNSDRILYNRIPLRTNKFINYGAVKNWSMNWRHPSAEVISDLIATGNANQIVPINEFIGLKIHFAIEFR